MAGIGEYVNWVKKLLNVINSRYANSLACVRGKEGES